MNDKNNQSQTELDFNRNNREEYETLMKESSTNLDGYWDKNNPVVKIVLFVLALVIIIGTVFVFMQYS